MNKYTFSNGHKNKIIGGFLVLCGLAVLLTQSQGLWIKPVEKAPIASTEVVTTNLAAVNHLSHAEKIPPGNVQKSITQSTETSKANFDQNIENTGIFLDTAIHYIHSHAKPEYEKPAIPDRIVIPSIKLNAPVISAEYNLTDIEGDTFGQWKAPSFFAAGWHPDSALIGEKGNTVINGHHNLDGEVFKRLVDASIGDVVNLYTNGQKTTFMITNRMIVPERFASLETRLENARWLGKSDDVRLTLVTCWPEYTNTHRLIIVAKPVDELRLD